MMTEGMVAGGVVVVALGAFKCIEEVVKRSRQNGSSKSVRQHNILGEKEHEMLSDLHKWHLPETSPGVKAWYTDNSRMIELLEQILHAIQDYNEILRGKKVS